MTPLDLYVYDCGTDAIAEAVRDELLSRHGWVDVESVGRLVVWPSTFAGAHLSGLVVASVTRVMCSIYRSGRS